MHKLMIKNGKLVKIETLPVTSCDGCGSCCMHMGDPPGYKPYFRADGEIPQWAKDSPDYERWLNLPADVKADLAEYYRAVQAGEIPDRTRFWADTEVIRAAASLKTADLVKAEAEIKRSQQEQTIPCLWLDEDTKRCKHYEHRPEVCRDSVMVPGNGPCLSTRKRFRIPLPVRV